MGLAHGLRIENIKTVMALIATHFLDHSSTNRTLSDTLVHNRISTHTRPILRCSTTPRTSKDMDTLLELILPTMETSLLVSL